MPTPPHNAASQWFHATESLGDFMGIRYGRIPNGSSEVEWFHVSHVECDGIGGFARLLRQHGAHLPQLPTTKAPCRGIVGPLWRLWKNRRHAPPCAKRSDWLRGQKPHTGPPTVLAWHVFTEQETKHILDTCRRLHITANSLLLHHLDASIRPELGLTKARLPWLIPVNLRTEAPLPDDAVNQVSCVDAVIAYDDTAHQIHQQIIHRLEQGEHRANFLLMSLGKFLSHNHKKRILTRHRSSPTGTIGSFSNLGSWDPQKQIPSPCAWLFCPPLATGQRVAAGCVTFQNRLSLMLQAHPDPSGSQDMTQRWMHRWTKRLTSPP